MSNVTCKARRVNDEYHCGRCGYQWDVVDDEPPPCKTEEEVKLTKPLF